MIDPLQHLLLTSCLNNDVEAYKEWVDRVDLDQLNRGEVRLMPLLGHILMRQGISDRFTQKLKGIHRFAWITNQRLLNHFQELQNHFDREGISAVLLKGAALNVTVYPSMGLRPMDDIDFLVNPDHVEKVHEILVGAGYYLMEGVVDVGCHFHYHHSLGYRNRNGIVVDMHAYILEDCCSDKDFHPLFHRSRLVKYKNGNFSVLQPTELFFHTMIHGVRWHPMAPVRWIVDCSLMLKSGSIDWALLIAYAKRYQLVSSLKEGLRILERYCGRMIPKYVPLLIKDIRVTCLDQEGHAFHASPYNGVICSVRHHLNHYKKAKSSHSFVQFCSAYWGVSTVAGFVKGAIKKCLKKITWSFQRDLHRG